MPGGGPSFQPLSPRPGIIALRPLTLSDIFEGAFAMIRGNPTATIGLSLLIGVICLVPTALVVWAVGQIPTGSRADAQAVYEAANAGAELILAIGGIIITGMLTAVLGEAILGRRMTIAQAWAAARPRVWSLIGLSLLVALSLAGMILAGTLIFVVLTVAAGGAGAVLGGIVLLVALCVAVMWWIRWSLAAPAVVLEHIGPREAMGRSRALTKGQFWRIFGITLLASLMAGVIAAIISLPFTMALGSAVTTTTSPSGTTSASLSVLTVFLLLCVAVVSGAIVRPFLAGVVGLLYIDQRIRREALDVALLNAANSQPPTP